MRPRRGPDALAPFWKLLLQTRAALGERVDVFHPWRDRAPDDLDAAAPKQRLERLQDFFSIESPSLLLIGEAPGWRGCRISGIPFASEDLLLSGSIPRVPIVRQRLTSRALPLREPSATIVWEALADFGLRDVTLLWNAFPYHPRTEGQPFSNRTPGAAERAIGANVLRELLAAFPAVTIAAVGQTAATVVTELTGAEVPVLRHPSFGGKTAFRNSLEELARTHGLLRPQPALFT